MGCALADKVSGQKGGGKIQTCRNFFARLCRGAYTTSPALDVLPELAALVLRGVERVAAAAVAVLAAVALLPRLHDPVPARRGRNCRKSTVEHYT